MNAGVPSRTAYGVAMRRAAHQLLDHPLVFEDPLAARIIGRDVRCKTAGPSTLRAFVAARSRYAEDELASCFAQGVHQYVVLGAGLDTFAYRNPHSPLLKVFEVDHPDTQDWKRERLQAAEIPLPASLTFVPTDFEAQTLTQVLDNASGFDSSQPALFSCLGVTPYLTRPAFEATLRCIASLPAGSVVVFDYAVPPSCLSLADRIAFEILSGRVARAGESFRLFLAPQELARLLESLEFTSVDDLGREEINALYFSARRDRLRIRNSIGRLVRARLR